MKTAIRKFAGFAWFVIRLIVTTLWKTHLDAWHALQRWFDRRWVQIVGCGMTVTVFDLIYRRIIPGDTALYALGALLVTWYSINRGEKRHEQTIDTLNYQNRVLAEMNPEVAQRVPAPPCVPTPPGQPPDPPPGPTVPIITIPK